MGLCGEPGLVVFPQVGEVKIHAVEAKAVIQIDAFAEKT